MLLFTIAASSSRGFEEGEEWVAVREVREGIQLLELKKNVFHWSCTIPASCRVGQLFGKATPLYKVVEVFRRRSILNVYNLF